MKPLRVAILCTDGREMLKEYSGKEPIFGTAPEALMQGFAAMTEAEFHVVSCTQRPLQSPARLTGNIFFHSVVVPKIGWMRTLYQGCIRAVRRKLKEISPDIVHGQGTERECAISAVNSGFPNVVTIHGNMAELARRFRSPIGSFGWLAARLEEFTLKRAGGVFCNSAYTEELVRKRTGKTWRVANPIREQFFSASKSPLSREKVRILNVGVISERKRQLELLGIAKKLHQSGLNFEMQFIGPLNQTEAYAARFVAELRDCESKGFARYLGCMDVNQLVTAMDEASALVHFPSEEAFGLVVAEALARNLKFFGSRVGGIPDISTGVEGAELFECDDWSGLADSMAVWAASGYSRSNQAALIISERYHPLQIAKRHLEIYREFLCKPR